MKVLSPFPLAVIIGFGTVFAISLLMILLPAGTPMLLYDVGRLMRGGVRGDPLFVILPLLSLVGYLEAGLMYAFFANRQSMLTRKGLDLVDEVGQDEEPTRAYPRNGAAAGALVGLLASLLSYLIFVVMLYLQLDEALPIGTILVGATISAGMSLLIAVIAGAILGAVGAMVGSRMQSRRA